MIRLSKLTDYGIVLMTLVARSPEHALHTARDLAQESGLPLPTVSKILKSLSTAGLLTSQRGVKGGYSLSRTPPEISVADIIVAMEGPIAVTECVDVQHGSCEFQRKCPASGNWRIISRALREALENLPLSALLAPIPLRDARELLVSLTVSGRPQ